VPGPGQRRPDLQRSSVQIGPYPNRPGDGRGLEVWLTPPFGSPGGLGQDQLVQRQVRDRPTQPQTLIFQRLQPFDLIVLCRRTPPSSGNTLSPSPQSFSLLRSSTCTDRSGHQPDAAWRRSLQACGASLPSFHPSKRSSDQHKGWITSRGSGQQYPAPTPSRRGHGRRLPRFQWGRNCCHPGRLTQQPSLKPGRPPCLSKSRPAGPERRGL